MKQLFSILKATEGGMGQRTAIVLLKRAGLKCRPAHSPYVGESGVEVEGTKRDMEKAIRILYNL